MFQLTACMGDFHCTVVQVDAAGSKELSERQLALGREYRDAQGTLEALTEDINADQAQLARLKGKAL